MAYLVNLLPNSMLYYIFYFKSLENEDVKKYEMKYTGDELLKVGISDLDKNINPTELKEEDKITFMKFYVKNLKDNLESCFNVNEGFKNLISYINKIIKTIKNSKGIYNIITEGGFPYELCKDLKSFLEDNKNITISKLTNLMKYLEKHFSN